MGDYYEFKLFVALILTFFIFILARTQSREKQRPILLLLMYLGYLSFQVFMMVDFYPLTSFQRHSYPDDNAAHYYKMKVLLDTGDVLDKRPAEILPFLKDKRVPRYVSYSLREQKDADRFTEHYARAYDKRFGEAGKPKIEAIHFEERKWHWKYEPHDSDQGFLLNRRISKVDREV